MAFPTTSVLDTFAGTNGADLPVYSANWGSVTGIATLEIQDGAAAGTGAFQEHLNYWAAADYGPDCEAYASINAIAGVALVAARLAQQTSSSTLDGYVVQASGFFASLFVQRYDNGVLTQLGAGISQTVGAGDKVGMEVVGSTITAYYNDSGGGWTNMGSRSDSTYTAAGKIGLGAGHTGDRIDDFGGGTISSGIGPAGFADPDGFGVAAVGAAIAPTGFADPDAFGVPAASAAIAPAGIPSSSSVGRPQVGDAPEPEDLVGLPGAHAWIGAAIGPHLLRPFGIPSSTVVGAPTVESAVVVARRLARRRRDERDLLNLLAI